MGGSSVRGVERRLQSTCPSYSGTGVLPVDNCWSPICTCIFSHTELLDALVADTSQQKVPFSILCTTVLCNHHVLVQGRCAGCQRSWSQRGPGLEPLIGWQLFCSTLTLTTYLPMRCVPLSKGTSQGMATNWSLVLAGQLKFYIRLREGLQPQGLMGQHTVLPLHLLLEDMNVVGRSHSMTVRFLFHSENEKVQRKLRD